MEKKFIIFIILLFFGILHSTEMVFKLNEKCKNDSNLILEQAVLSDHSLEFELTYKNNTSSKKSIGIFPPDSKESIFLYNSDGSKIYPLKDITNIPKWWPKKKYVLQSNEILNFKLIFDSIEPTTSVNLVEGKGNFNNKTGWNFLNLNVNTFSFIDKKTIELLEKVTPSEEELNELENLKKYDYINDFISYYKNPSEDLKLSYLEKWKNDKRAIYFIDFLLKKDYDNLILKPDIQKAYVIIKNYPLSNTSKELKKFIKPILLKEIMSEYQTIKNSKELDKLIKFLKKYSKFETIYGELSDLTTIKAKIKNFINKKREELKNSEDPNLYHEFFKKYGTKSFKNTIYADYLELEKKFYEKTILINNPTAFEKFLEYFPDSPHKNEIHKQYFEYLKTNNVSIEQITNYVGKYPDSPYIDDILKLLPKKSTQLVKSENKKSEYASLEEKIEAFKNSIKVDDIIHFVEKTSIMDANSQEKIFNVRYSAKIIAILKTKLRIKIIDLSLTIDNPPSYALDGIKDLKDVMVGNIEDKDIKKIEEFKHF